MGSMKISLPVCGCCSLKARNLPLGCHDSGNSRFLLSVKRWGAPVPSARCQCRPSESSRNDLNAIRWPSVDRAKLQAAELRDGHYLLRSNLTAEDPAVLWARYVLLTQIEAVFRSLKTELRVRPIYHQLEHRADAHILIAFLAYCLQITLKHHLMTHAPGLTPTSVMEKLATIQMIDVCIPTTDGRWLILPRYTQPDPDT